VKEANHSFFHHSVCAFRKEGSARLKGMESCMRVIGIIAEYNPFHNGHLYHLNEARAITGASYVVAVLSGNFVQRGEPAIVDKITRTKMALAAGIDVVVELPHMYAMSSAGYFASGAVSLLDNLGVVDGIAFGTEANLADIEVVAKILRDEPESFKATLKAGLDRGLSYPDARARALISEISTNVPELIKGPNNILGIEYINAIARLGSKMSVTAIKRTVPHIGGRLGRFASASEIRKSLLSGNFEEGAAFMPDFTVEILRQAGTYHRLNNLSDAFQYKIRSCSPSGLREIAEVSEGLENRFISSSREYANLDDIILHAKTKRYTLSKIKRCALNILLDVRRDDFVPAQKYGPAYARVLGFRKESQALLGFIAENSRIPFISNLKHLSGFDTLTQKLIETELRTTDIYALSADKEGLSRLKNRREEYKTPIVY